MNHLILLDFNESLRKYGGYGTIYEASFSLVLRFKGEDWCSKNILIGVPPGNCTIFNELLFTNQQLKCDHALQFLSLGYALFFGSNRFQMAQRLNDWLIKQWFCVAWETTPKYHNLKPDTSVAW